jgi:hypothetical protein
MMQQDVFHYSSELLISVTTIHLKHKKLFNKYDFKVDQLWHMKGI